MTAIDVACATDAAYIPHAAAMIHSILDCARRDGDRVHVHVLHGTGIGEDRLAAVAGMARGSNGEISLHRIDDRDVAGLPDWGRIPVTMWYRILLPELLLDVDRILYLDCDTVAVDSLSPLWELDLGSHYLGAVTNIPERHMLGHAQELGLRGPQDYFNSGVLLLNLEQMRRDDSAEKLRACALERRSELLWPDQDALNLVLGDRRLALHPRWNVMNSVRKFEWAGELVGEREVEEAIARPAILHFEGPRENKPWHLMCDHPNRDVYFSHRRATSWPRCRREGVTPRNLARLAAQHLTASRQV